MGRQPVTDSSNTRQGSQPPNHTLPPQLTCDAAAKRVEKHHKAHGQTGGRAQHLADLHRWQQFGRLAGRKREVAILQPTSALYVLHLVCSAKRASTYMVKASMAASRGRGVQSLHELAREHPTLGLRCRSQPLACDGHSAGQACRPASLSKGIRKGQHSGAHSAVDESQHRASGGVGGRLVHQHGGGQRSRHGVVAGGGRPHPCWMLSTNPWRSQQALNESESGQ